jgi:hypothetical protein
MKIEIVILSALLLSLPPLCGAQTVYRFNGESGVPVFTNKPPPPESGAEQITLPDPGEPANREERVERINDTATMLRDDREAREQRRDEQRRAAREDQRAREAAEAASEPVVIQQGGGWYRPGRPGHRPGWGPGYRPRPPHQRPQHPIYRPPQPYPEPPQPSGGALRGAGPQGRGW